MSDPYDHVVVVNLGFNTVSVLNPIPVPGVSVYEPATSVTEVVVTGPQGIPGAGVILLEASETEPPVDTPEGSIIFRKLS